MSSVNTLLFPHSESVYLALLNNYDILVYLFDTLETRTRGLGRSTLASCALVSRSWTEPASRVLWRHIDSLHPLWALLAGLNFPVSASRLSDFWELVDGETFVKSVVKNESGRWEHFLYRASHVRYVGTASCRKPELALIQAVVKYNGGATFLPALQKLVWRHGFASDLTLLSLAPKTLQDLELSSIPFAMPMWHPDGRLKDETLRIEELFAGLPDAAPSLRRLVVSGRQLPGPIVAPHLLRLTQMRELLLFNDIFTLGPSDMHALLEHMPVLQVLSARVEDLAGCHVTCARSASLRELRLRGFTQDLEALFIAGLDAPALVSLRLSIQDEVYSPHIRRCLQALSDTSLSTSLRALKVETLYTSDPEDADMTIAGPLATIVEPLERLRLLENVELMVLNAAFLINEADILLIAQAWKHLRRLVLSYNPATTQLPPLASLRHFATHCPELLYLALTKMAVPTQDDTPQPTHAVRSTGAQHPLETLDLKMTFASQVKYDTVGIARFLDGLFPNLVLGEEVQWVDLGGYVTPWNRVEKQISALKARRDVG
ncbi:hypothetical protein C8Q79DRAFT_899137 [Trametes meyenii]|nr:hypothetical protein C8Q79DRAFT_899137 [Trametes meyenii]